MIKKFFLSLMFLSVVASASSVQWEKDLESAIAKAKKLHKPVMLVVNRDGCGWCERFRAGTLSDPEVVKKLNNDFVSFEGYTNRGSIPEELFTDGTPGTWFLKEGEPMYQPMLGAQPVPYFLEALDIIVDEFQENNQTKK